MFFETELSEKLNSELESVGISVSEALIAKTLAAVQAAKNTETEADLENEIKQGIQNLAELRKAKRTSVRSALLRAATVMAACFVLVVGAFALRFSTMRMGKENAAPMAMDESGSARNGIAYVADSDSVASGEDAKCIQETEAETVASVEPVVPTIEDDGDAVTTEVAMPLGDAVEEPEIQENVKLLTEKLAQADTVEKELTSQGTTVYRFVVCDTDGTTLCYLIHENGTVEFAEMMTDGETGAVMVYDGTESKEFRKSVLVWMKQNGY